MPGKIDFNCDMGENFGAYKLANDEEVIKHITSANIACGFHASDPMWMRYTVSLAEENGVAVGAHPGFPDLKGFGRRNIIASGEEVKNDLIYQMGALTAFTKGKKLQHMKPHGALYNMVMAGGDMAKGMCEAVLEVDPEIILMVLYGTPLVEIAKEMGVRIALESFADRAVSADGTLVPRSVPGSVIHDQDELVKRSVRMITEGKVTAITGEEVNVSPQTLCLHGDTPGADEKAAALRAGLEAAGIELVPLTSLA